MAGLLNRDLKGKHQGSLIIWYVMLQKFVSMVVSGLGSLALGWSTVVLLGGFVTLLQTKDFWYLTVLNLLQVLRIFNPFDDEKFFYLTNMLLEPIFVLIIKVMEDRSFACLRGVCPWLKAVVATIVESIQYLFILIVATFLVALFPSLIVISIAIPIARLKKQDYADDIQDKSTRNLEPALNIFYTLSLVHGFLYCALYILLFFEPVLVKNMITRYGFERWAQTSVRGYLKETRDRCGKEPFIAYSWNIQRYAVGLLESESLEDYLSSLLMIGTFMEQSIPVGPLIWSSKRKTKRLLRTLGWTSPEDQEIRVLAARIVANIAGHIQLGELPGATKSISSLLETSMQSSSKRQTIYKEVECDEHSQASTQELIVNGLLILERLAEERHNCTEIYCTEGLLGNIIQLIRSNTMIPYANGGNAWEDIVSRSMSVVRQLVSAPGETGRNIRHIVSSNVNKAVVINMENVLRSDIFPLQAREHALVILKELAVDLSEGLFSGTQRKNLIDALLFIYLMNRDGEQSLVLMAGEAVVNLLQEKEISSTAFLDTTECDNVVEKITHVIDNATSSVPYMTVAAKILENLIVNCKISESYVKDTALPKILKALLQPTRQEAATAPLLVAENDAEDPHRSTLSSQDIQPASSEQNDEQHMKRRKLDEALLSLIYAIRDKCRIADDLVGLADGPEELEFVRKLKQIVEGNSHETLECLRMQKVVANLVVSMLKHNQYIAIRNQGLVQSLCEASTTVKHLDECMVAHGTHGDIQRSAGPLLSTIVGEAKELINQRNTETQ